MSSWTNSRKTGTAWLLPRNALSPVATRDKDMRCLSPRSSPIAIRRIRTSRLSVVRAGQWIVLLRGCQICEATLKFYLQSCQSAVMISVRFRSILFYKQNHLAPAAHRLEAVGTKKRVTAIGYSLVRGRRILEESRHFADTIPLNGV